MSHPGRFLLSACLGACLAAVSLTGCGGDDGAAVRALQDLDGVSRVALRHDPVTSRGYAMVVPDADLNLAQLASLLRSVNESLDKAEAAPDRIVLAAPTDRDSVFSVDVSNQPVPDRALQPWLQAVDTMAGPVAVGWRPEDATIKVTPTADLVADLRAATRLRQDAFAQWEFDPTKSTDDGVMVTGEFSPVLAVYLADFVQQAQTGPDPIELRMVVEPTKTDLIATINLGIEPGTAVEVPEYADRLRPLALAARTFFKGSKSEGALVVHTGATFLGTSEPADAGDPEDDWSAWLQQMVRGHRLPAVTPASPSAR